MNLTKEYIDNIVCECDIKILSAFDKCTIVACRMPNGFIIVESHTCTDKEHYDSNLGVAICMEKIKKSISELEGYMLHNLNDIDYAVDYARHDDDCFHMCQFPDMECENCCYYQECVRDEYDYYDDEYFEDEWYK